MNNVIDNKVRLRLHLGYLRQLQWGHFSQSDLAVPGMTIAQAIRVERKNVRYCVRQLRAEGK